MTKEFIPLQISTIPPKRPITFELFIHFKDQYLCYVNKDTQLEEDKLEKLRTQKVARFYILRQDEANYQGFLDSLLEDALKDEAMAMEKKVEIVEGAAATGVEGMTKNPNSMVSYKITQKAAKSLREVIESNPEALKKVYGKMSEELTGVIKHALNVCALSTKLGKNQGLTEKQLDDLATAALIHDLGLSKLQDSDKVMFDKARKLLSPGDWSVYKHHAEDSVKMLSDKPYVNENIIELVRTHEDNLTGMGPNKLTKMPLDQQILSMVNCYDKKILTQKLTAKEAAKELQIDDLGKWDLKLIQAFIKMLEKDGFFE